MRSSNHTFLGDEPDPGESGKSSLLLFGRGRASVVLLRRRWRTRARCRATPCLSRLSCLPKRWPLALEFLPLRRLTPVEVVWRPGDPSAHYRPCGQLQDPLAPRSGTLTPKIRRASELPTPLAN